MDDERFPHTADDPLATRTRRALLASGLAVTASGLLLPADLSAARGRGRKPGNMRDRRRERREAREDRREDRRGNPPPRRIGLRDVWFEVHNETGHGLAALRWMFVQIEGWRRMEDFTLPPDRPWWVYTENSTLLALQVYRNHFALDRDKVILGQNVLLGPETASIVSGRLRADGRFDGHREVWEQALAVGQKAEAINTVVERLPDDDDYKRFRVTLRPD